MGYRLGYSKVWWAIGQHSGLFGGGYRLCKLSLLTMITPRSGGFPVLQGFFGEGSEDISIYLSNVRCNGTERSLIQCQHDGLGVHDCDHSEDAGVICISKYELFLY